VVGNDFKATVRQWANQPQCVKVMSLEAGTFVVGRPSLLREGAVLAATVSADME
jgi:hypothetical protein